LITGLSCSSNRYIVDRIEWKLWVALEKTTHRSHHQIICTCSGIERSSFSEWGANCINKNN
jgi:hypothetical protein